MLVHPGSETLEFARVASIPDSDAADSKAGFAREARFR